MDTKALTREQLEAQIEALKAEKSALLAKERSQFTLKVGESGGVSVYGMGRFPVTLYPEQWDKVFSHAEEIKNFCTANTALIQSRIKARKSKSA